MTSTVCLGKNKLYFLVIIGRGLLTGDNSSRSTSSELDNVTSSSSCSSWTLITVNDNEKYFHADEEGKGNDWGSDDDQVASHWKSYNTAIHLILIYCQLGLLLLMNCFSHTHWRGWSWGGGVWNSRSRRVASWRIATLLSYKGIITSFFIWWSKQTDNLNFIKKNNNKRNERLVSRK